MNEAHAEAKVPKRKSQSLINRTHLRRFLLDHAARTRSHKFHRVSEETFQVLEAKLRNLAIDTVSRHPSVGKTIFPIERPPKLREDVVVVNED